MKPLPRYAALCLTILAWPIRVARRRQALAALAELDDRALADFGLSRQDLRDASAFPLAADPTAHFEARARERAEAAAQLERDRAQRPASPRRAAE